MPRHILCLIADPADTAVSPAVVAGAMADATGNYRLGFTILALTAGCGSLLFLLAKKPA